MDKTGHKTWMQIQGDIGKQYEFCASLEISEKTTEIL